MAVPVALIAKAAVTLVTDKRTWKVIGVIIAAIATPIIIIVMAIASIGSGAASHNNAAIDYAWNGGTLSSEVPPDYRAQLESIRACFVKLDNEISIVSSMIEDGGLDCDRVKSIFYALYFDKDNLSSIDCAAFVNCFVDTEQRTRIVVDENGNETEETYIVKIPVPLSVAYSRLGALTGIPITAELQDNANQIYLRAMFGDNLPIPGFPRGDSDIVDVAISQLGNVGGAPYWSWYGFNSRVAWCACFVSWCAEQCGYIEAGIIPKFAGCMQGSQWFMDNNLWQRGGYTPSPGDIIFFDWEGDGSTDHVGIVEIVENGNVYTIEGNTSDSCARRKYALTSSVIYGYGTPLYPPKPETPFINVGLGGFISPLGANWRSMVTSEFGSRTDPFDSNSQDNHTGLDMEAAKGTAIKAARAGKVIYVSYSNSGYGYHIVIDHGNGMATLYAHCSQIFVREGQEVSQGALIAAVGSTGKSTGNHLHFEVRIGGKCVDPRLYLP